MVANIPMAASDVSAPSDTDASGSEVLVVDFGELEQIIDQELDNESPEEMTDRHELADELGGEEKKEENLQERMK